MASAGLLGRLVTTRLVAPNGPRGRERHVALTVRHLSLKITTMGVISSRNSCNDGLRLDVQTKCLGAQYASALMLTYGIIACKEGDHYFESRPVRRRSIATSCSAFQNKKLGSLSPHWMYG